MTLIEPTDPFPAVLELSSLNGTNGFSIPQLATYDYLGNSVAGVGDVNGDGKADILLGAWAPIRPVARMPAKRT